MATVTFLTNEDRLAYVDGTELGTFIPEMSVDFSVKREYGIFDPYPRYPSEGETFVVRWNGVDYTLQAHEMQIDRQSFAFAMVLEDESGNAPFEKIHFYCQEYIDYEYFEGYYTRIFVNQNISEPVTVEIFGQVEKIKPIDLKFMPEEVKDLLNGTTGSGGLPAPEGPNLQLVTDSEGNWKQAERLAWADMQEVVVLNETSLTFEGDMIPLTEPFVTDPIEGGQYTVMWNGTRYECIGTIGDIEGLSTIVLGNATALGIPVGNGEPFAVIAISPDVAGAVGAYGLVLPMDGAENIMLSIAGIAEVVHQIDEKYIKPVGASFLRNGSQLGSVRSFASAPEDSDYTIGSDAFAFGSDTKAPGDCAFAEGQNTIASGSSSHAEGCNSVASSSSAHAEGDSTVASGPCAHAEGGDTVAKGLCSHAEGLQTIASDTAQHVEGRYNIESTKYLHIAGNGSSSKHSNAYTLDWKGNAWFAGDVYVGGTQQSEGAQLLTLNNIPAASSSTKGLITTDAQTLAGEKTFNSNIKINGSYYPSLELVSTTLNSNSTYSKGVFEGSAYDNVSMWIWGDKNNSGKSRRGLVLQGYAAKDNDADALILRRCDPAGNWKTDLNILHSENYNQYAVSRDEFEPDGRYKYLVSDSTGKPVWEERPYYEEAIYNENIIPNTSLTFIPCKDPQYIAFNAPQRANGDTFSIIYNGTTYTMTINLSSAFSLEGDTFKLTLWDISGIGASYHGVLEERVNDSVSFEIYTNYSGNNIKITSFDFNLSSSGWAVAQAANTFNIDMNKDNHTMIYGDNYIPLTRSGGQIGNSLISDLAQIQGIQSMNKNLIFLIKSNTIVTKNVKLSIKETIVHTIDEKYLPSSIVSLINRVAALEAEIATLKS